MAKIIIDPAHGGCDTRYIFGERKDKVDNLALAMEIGTLLEEQGIDVAYTRTEDVYIPVYERVNMINEEDGDLLLSLRWVDASAEVGLPSIKFFVSEEGGIGTKLAENILMKLPEGRYQNYGISVITETPIINDINKPGLIIEIGYPKEQVSAVEFEMISREMAMVISEAIIQTLSEETVSSVEENQNNNEVGTEMGQMYSVQIGLFRILSNAENMLREIEEKGFDGEIVPIGDGDFYSVHVGKFTDMDDAAALEQILRIQGYNTLLITVNETSES